MKKHLTKLPSEIKNIVSLSRKIAAKNNARAYLVGGCVRDLLLNEKNLDLDIVVEGSGIQFAEELAGAFNARLIRHKRFGTATLILPGSHLKVDIATARKEYYPHPAHLPVVEPGGLREDLYRRDFTINAMAIGISGGQSGRLIDFFGGKEDLANKKVRVLHDLSFIDDPTRILRGIRFEQRLGFRFESGTLELLKQSAGMGMLEKVEPQRMRDELILCLKEDLPLRVIRRIESLAGFVFIGRNFSVSGRTMLLLNSAQRQISLFKNSYPKRRQVDSWLIYFMALTDSLSKKELAGICKKFVFRKGEEKRMLGYKKSGAGFISRLKKAKGKPSLIFSLLEPLSYEVILLIMAKYKDAVIRRICADFFEAYNGMKIYSSGRDLCSLGVRPGPCYGRIFAKVLEAKLEGIVRTRQEELGLIKKLIKKRS